MKQLYNLYDALNLIKKKRINLIILIVLAVVLVTINIVLICFSPTFPSILILYLLTVSYLFYLLTYLLYYRTKYNDKYHFLAKIQNLPHDVFLGEIEKIDNVVTTIKKCETFQIFLKNHRVIFIECSLFTEELHENRRYTFDIVDSFVVGYKGETNE